MSNYNYKILKSSELPHESKWNTLLPKDLQVAISGRKEGHLLTRLSLCDTLSKNYALNLKMPLFEKNFHELNESSDILFSYSHTEGFGGAVACLKKDYRSIGIDIELTTRPIDLGAKKYFINELDEAQNYNLLTLWCIKEACFKCANFEFNEVKLLKEIWIKNNQFGTILNFKQALGTFEIIQNNNLNLIIVIATISF